MDLGWNLWNPRHVLKPRRNLSLKQGYLKLYQKWNTAVTDRRACLVRLEERNSGGIGRSCPTRARPPSTTRSDGHRRMEPAAWPRPPAPPRPPLAPSDCVQLPEFLVGFFFFFFLSKIAQNDKPLQNENNQKTVSLLSLWERMKGPTALRWIRKTEQRCLSIQ